MNGWGRKARYLKANINFLCIARSMRQLLRWWNDSIVMRIKETHVKLSGCLFIIYFRSKFFEHKKGSIKILVYGSVIDIDQMAGCNLFCSNFYQRLRAIWVGSFTCLRLFFWLHFQGVCSFSKTKWQMPEGMGTLGIDWAITQATKSLVSTYDIFFFHKMAN